MTASTTTATSQVRVERDGAACRITIDRADAHNTMTDAVMAALVEALQQAEAMEGVRAIVLTGAGDKTFCAGGHLKPTADGSPFALEPGRFDNPVAELFRALERCNLPIIARVNGGAFGGGLGLVCACDFAIATEGAMFGTTEARVGVFPMMILPVLMRVIPRRRLQEMCFFAQRFTAAEAQRFDIVNAVVPAGELDGAVDAMVARLAANSPVALRIGRRAISAIHDLAFGDALNLAQAILPVLSQSEDTREGMKAFAERRAPVWPGR
ncbi:enoyl-CoA hydratase-related protein [Variovorax sp. dw_954]|uniref:enoyl-CoA hydratase-related protein n=1 Tax=Variovorax sp. dw_954 TaxID=2720078 RepID=UPI001BD4F685|nr:enoyl-CoA hydratase-related protein [Variovorax sp. dw_954]